MRHGLIKLGDKIICPERLAEDAQRGGHPWVGRIAGGYLAFKRFELIVLFTTTGATIDGTTLSI